MSTTSTITDTAGRRPMRRPPTHPGEILRQHHLEPLGLTVTRLAEVLGVSRKHLSKVVNGRAGITPDMALRLSRALGASPEMWLGLQQRYDLWQAAHADTGWLGVPRSPFAGTVPSARPLAPRPKNALKGS